MEAFKALGMRELVNMAAPNSKGRELMSKLGVGMISTGEFCDEAR